MGPSLNDLNLIGGVIISILLIGFVGLVAATLNK